MAIHRARSLTGAATLLGVSQPTVTARLQALEHLTATRLFDRGARGCQPTPAADDLATRLHRPLTDLEAVAATLGGASDLSRTTLRLGAPAEFTERLLPAALASLAGTGMTVHLTLGLADRLRDDLAEGRLDLVVSTVKPPARTTWQALTHEEFVLVAAHALARRLAASLRDDPAAALHDVPRIAYDAQQSIVRRWWRHVLGTPPPGPPQIVVGDLRAVQSLVEAGAGVSVLPRYLCEKAIRARRLTMLLDPPDAPINTLYLVTLPHLRARAHVAAAWSAIASEFAHPE